MGPLAQLQCDDNRTLYIKVDEAHRAEMEVRRLVVRLLERLQPGTKSLKGNDEYDIVIQLPQGINGSAYTAKELNERLTETENVSFIQEVTPGLQPMTWLVAFAVTPRAPFWNLLATIEGVRNVCISKYPTYGGYVVEFFAPGYIHRQIRSKVYEVFGQEPPSGVA